MRYFNNKLSWSIRLNKSFLKSHKYKSASFPLSNSDKPIEQIRAVWQELWTETEMTESFIVLNIVEAGSLNAVIYVTSSAIKDLIADQTVSF